LGLPFLPPGHASKIHVHTADSEGDPDDAARPANKYRDSPSDFVRTLSLRGRPEADPEGMAACGQSLEGFGQMQCSLPLVPLGCLQLFACKNLGDFRCIGPENQEDRKSVV
jgi:hypothetical protein